MVNRKNYKLTREFLQFKKDIKQLNENSIRRYKSALNHFLLWLDSMPMENCVKNTPSFPSYLQNHHTGENEKLLSITTQKKIVQITKQFLNWVKMSHPQQFRKIHLLWVDSLHAPSGAPEHKEHEFISLKEVCELATKKPPNDLIVFQRDQAAAAMLYLSGMRASSFASLPIKAVDIGLRQIKQWPSLGVRTKFKKHATTYLLDIPVLLDVVERWDTFVRKQLPDSAMWYPIMISEWALEELSSAKPGKNRHIQLAKRIRKLSQLLGLEYKSPHKFRHGHAVYALLKAKDMADYKAISQNLMHSDIKVTDSIYAWLNNHQIKDRISGLSSDTNLLTSTNHPIQAYLSQLSKDELKQAISTSLDLIVAG